MLNQTMNVKYEIFKQGSSFDLASTKVWQKTFRLSEYQIPCNLQFILRSLSMIGLSVSYEFSLFQVFEKVYDDFGRLSATTANKKSPIAGEEDIPIYTVKKPLDTGIYRVVVEHKSKLQTDPPLQFSISTPIFSISSMELQPGDPPFISPQLIVLKEMGAIDVTVELRLLPKPLFSQQKSSSNLLQATAISGSNSSSIFSTISGSGGDCSNTGGIDGASYDIVVIKEPDGMKQILDNKKKSFFKMHIKDAVVQKDLDTLGKLFSPENKDVLEDPAFFKEVNKENLAEIGLEMYDSGMDLCKRLRETADTYNKEKIRDLCLEASSYNLEKSKELSLALSYAYNAIDRLNDRKKYYEELCLLANSGTLTLENYDLLKHKKKEAFDKLGALIFPKDATEANILDKVEKTITKFDDIRSRQQTRLFALERLFMLEDVKAIEFFLLENSKPDDLPRGEYQKAQLTLESIKRKTNLDDRVKYKQYLEDQLAAIKNEQDLQKQIGMENSELQRRHAMLLERERIEAERVRLEAEKEMKKLEEERQLIARQKSLERAKVEGKFMEQAIQAERKKQELSMKALEVVQKEQSLDLEIQKSLQSIKQEMILQEERLHEDRQSLERSLSQEDNTLLQQKEKAANANIQTHSTNGVDGKNEDDQMKTDSLNISSESPAVVATKAIEIPKTEPLRQQQQQQKQQEDQFSSLSDSNDKQIASSTSSALDTNMVSSLRPVVIAVPSDVIDSDSSSSNSNSSSFSTSLTGIKPVKKPKPPPGPPPKQIQQQSGTETPSLHSTDTADAIVIKDNNIITSNLDEFLSSGDTEIGTKDTQQKVNSALLLQKSNSVGEINKNVGHDSTDNVSLTTPTLPENIDNSGMNDFSSTLPAPISSLHRSLINLIRITELQQPQGATGENCVIKNIEPFSDDLDVVVNALVNLITNHRAESLLFRVSRTPLEIFRKLDKTLIGQFCQQKSFLQIPNDSNRYRTEAKLLVQYLMHVGQMTKMIRQLIDDEKYLGTVYSSESFLRNLEHRDELFLTIDLISQSKYKFLAFMEKDEIKEAIFDQQGANNLVPLELSKHESLLTSSNDNNNKKKHQSGGGSFKLEITTKTALTQPLLTPTPISSGGSISSNSNNNNNNNKSKSNRGSLDNSQPLAEPEIQTIKSTKSKKTKGEKSPVHQLKTIQQKVSDYFLAECRTRTMEEVGRDHEISRIFHEDLMPSLESILTNGLLTVADDSNSPGFIDTNLISNYGDLWSVLTKLISLNENTDSTSTVKFNEIIQYVDMNVQQHQKQQQQQQQYTSPTSNSSNNFIDDKATYFFMFIAK